MAYTREETVDLALTYKGAKQGSAKHHKIVDTFNSVHPHGERMTYDRAWCACTVTAWEIMAGYKPSNMPMSCSCKRLIKYQKELQAKGLGKWVENDAWKEAEMGDLVIYYWYAEKTGDCKKYTSHVGMIVDRTKTGYKVIEGNKSKKVGMRDIPFNYRYVRGFCHPKYTEEKPVGKIVVDGNFGKVSIKRAQQYFHTTVDGRISGQKKAYARYYKGIDQSRVTWGGGGSKLIIEIQKMVGVDRTGILDKKTIKALQKFLGIVVDGKWGKVTSKAFQTWLNERC